ncbi:MAG: Ig-like domain-containing protein [Deinococcales bacterium]
MRPATCRSKRSIIELTVLVLTCIVLLLDGCSTSPAPAVKSVSIDQSDFDMLVGSTSSPLTATVEVVGGAGTSITWTSDTVTVATVAGHSGVVTAIAPGSAKITATSIEDASKHDSVTVTVVTAPAVVSVTIDQASMTLLEGERATLTATVNAVAAASSDVLWSSSDSSVVTVDADTGEITGMATGSAQITATSVFDPSKSDTLPVQVSFGTFAVGAVLAPEVPPYGSYARDFVAVDNDLALVPIVRDTSGATIEGQVDVYERPSGGGWAKTATLIPPQGSSAYQNFGKVVLLRGTTAAVMAEHKGVESTIHMFERSSSGSWDVKAILLRDEGVGTQVPYEISAASSAHVLVVGLPHGYASTVRVYEQDAGGASAWGLAHVIPLPPAIPDYGCCWFGTDVDVSEDGNLIAVAHSSQINDGGLWTSERAYIYERNAADPTSWDLIDEIDASELPSNQSTYVAIDGDILAITHMPAVYSGEAEVAIYQRGVGGTNKWGRVATHTLELPPMAEPPGNAHTTLRLRGTTLAVGITWFNDGSGEVHVFGRNVGGPDHWGEAQVLHANPAYDGQMFGAALDISSDGHTLGAGTHPGAAASYLGEVFLFYR